MAEDFIAKHSDTNPIIVADAAMFDDDRLAELREKEISYLIDARLANCNLDTMKQVHGALC